MDEELAAFAAAEGRRRGWFESSLHAPDRSAAAVERDAQLVEAIGAATATMLATTRSPASDDTDPVVVAWQHRIDAATPITRPEETVMRSFADRYVAAASLGAPIVRTRSRSSSCTRCHRRLRPGDAGCRRCTPAGATTPMEDDAETTAPDDVQSPAPASELNLAVLLVAVALCIGAALWSVHDLPTRTPDRAEQGCVRLGADLRPMEC